jgi:hypothetical protein
LLTILEAQDPVASEDAWEAGTFAGCRSSEELISVGLGMMPRWLRAAAARVRENTVRTFEGVDRTLLLREVYERDPTHFDLRDWSRRTALLILATAIISAPRSTP